MSAAAAVSEGDLGHHDQLDQMDPDETDYADHHVRSRLPTPAALTLFAVIGMGVVLNVGAVLAAVIALHGSSPAP